MTTPGFDPTRTARDLLIAWRCERFEDTRPIDALRELKRNRGETRL